MCARATVFDPPPPNRVHLRSAVGTGAGTWLVSSAIVVPRSYDLTGMILWVNCRVLR